jgi:hypothetical protein
MSSQNDQWDIFLCFAGKRQVDAQAFYGALSPHARVFFSPAQQDKLANWAAEIRRAQQKSDSTVVLVSVEGKDAYYQQEEVALGISLSRESGGAHKVIPVYLDGRPKATEWNLYGLHILQDVSVPEVGGINAAVDRVLVRLGLALGPKDDAPEAGPRLAAAQNQVLLRFPRTPRIDTFRIDVSIIRECANAFSPTDAVLIVMEANRFRLETDADAGLIERGSLPPSLSEPIVYWSGVFNLAANQGPRMLAALLLSINDGQFPERARLARRNLLDYLQSLSGVPVSVRLPASPGER